LSTYNTDTGWYTNANGANPQASLAQDSDGSLYGTTARGGGGGTGTVFKMTTNNILTTLHSFTSARYYLGGESNADGAYPEACLTLGSDGTFYGTTHYGGSSGYGTVFNVKTNGMLTSLANFNSTNGAYPNGSLTLGNNGNFYGTTYSGGTSNMGTVFQVTTNGGLTTLVNFTGTNGATPYAGLALGNDSNFYGATYSGGSANMGTVFQVTTNGRLTTLISFSGTNGANPYASLALCSDGQFYGTTYSGGSSGYGGTAFQVTTNGRLTTLANFSLTNGANPYGRLTTDADGNFYGTTANGGNGGGGVIFRLNKGVYVQSFGMSSNGFQLRAINVGGSGVSVVETSADLSNWTPVFTNWPSSEPVEFLDAAATHQPHRFYRLRQQ
jgi:uncharacterized repeat protein (TIGR03803 family)